MFKVLRNGLLRYILYTCPNLWCNSCSKCYGMDCFGTCFTHVQTCDVTRVQSATEWTASVHAYTCPNLWCNSCSKCYGMDCFGAYFTHVQNLWCNSCSKVLRHGLFGTYFTHVQNLWCNLCSKCYGMDAPMLWSWSIVVNDNGGLKMPRALTCGKITAKMFRS